jgi:hypothetical protein
MLTAFLIFIIVLVVAPPLLAKQREKNVSSKLKNVHNAAEVMAIMDGAIRENKTQGDFLKWLRMSYFFWL